MIIVEPFGGLANRMRAIASAISLSSKLNAKLLTVWHESQELNCSFDKLFLSNPLFTVTAKAKKHRVIKATNQPNFYKYFMVKLLNKLNGIDYCIQEQDFHRLIWPGKLNIFQTAKNHKNIYIQTCERFDEIIETIQSFKPIPKIQNIIDLICQSFDEHTIGVHIRRTDNTIAIENSPVDLFIKEMEKLIIIQDKTNFFLATDDANIEQQLVTKFENRIMVYQKEFNRRTVKGIQDAVVDLFCLSKTTKILGSYWSSYAEVAVCFNNIELQIIKNSI